MAWCESNGVDYVFGLARNTRLVANIAAELAGAQDARTCCGHPRLWIADKSWMAGTSPATTTDVTEYDRNML
jgi:hypothetical protein